MYNLFREVYVFTAVRLSVHAVQARGLTLHWETFLHHGLCFGCILQEQVETPESSSTHSGLTTERSANNANTTAPSGGEQTEEDEAEDDGAVELPPPMEEIHTHPLPTTGGTTSSVPAPTSTPPGGANVEDVHAQLVSNAMWRQ